MAGKIQKFSFRINPNELALNQRKFDTQEIGRGIGTHKAMKGKGSYNRKAKHKMNYSRDDYGSFFLRLAEENNIHSFLDKITALLFILSAL